ncbi:MAG: hypothetical protein Q9M75_01145 [Ghiorsea sp.]|nr:hypothetical protein [Ghiorsea sp.]
MDYIFLIPYWFFWQLEDRRANAVLYKGDVWVKILADRVDNNSNGILDGYERTGHLHLQDNPNVGVH